MSTANDDLNQITQVCEEMCMTSQKKRERTMAIFWAIFTPIVYMIIANPVMYELTDSILSKVGIHILNPLTNEISMVGVGVHALVFTGVTFLGGHLASSWLN